MRFGTDHSIFLVDKDSIRKVSPEGQVVTLFRGIKEPSPKYQPFDNGNPDVSNRVYGLDVDSGSGDLLVAYHGNRSILRIREMERQVIYRSNKPWSPVGVAISPDGVVIKESGLEPGSDQMGPRIRLLHKDKSIETLVTVP